MLYTGASVSPYHAEKAATDLKLQGRACRRMLLMVPSSVGSCWEVSNGGMQDTSNADMVPELFALYADGVDANSE